MLLRCETKATRTARELEGHAFLQGFYKAWSMGCGPCTICRECDLDSPCKHSGKSRPAMEACGVDVFKTVRDNGMEIEVVTGRSQTPRFFSVVLVE